MAEKMLIPAIRFKKFTEEWEENELDSLFSKIKNAFVGTSTPYYVDQGHFYLESNNVKNGQINRNSEIFINDFFYKKQEDNWLHTDDIVMVQSGHVGHSAVIPVELNNIAAHALIIFADKKKQVCSYFLNYQFQTDISKAQIGNITTGNTIKHILSSEMKKFKVLLPQVTQQTQIGGYFQSLDKLISLHQAEYNKLVNLKKAMLEKMFPKNGAVLPEIRFKGFEGDWEEKRLGEDVADIVGGGTPSSFESSYWNGNIDWYSPTEIGTEVFANSSVKKITELGLKNSSAKLLPANKTILFTSRAGIGDMAILKRIGATNQGFQSLVLKDGYDTYFIYSMGVLIKDFAIRYSSGSTFLEISGKMLGKMVLRIPSIIEQQKIGTYFQNLDKLVNLHQTELDKLDNLKKACLEKMFV